MSMKWVFDFDGVLTEQTEEALRVREIFAQGLAEKTETPLSIVENHIAAIEKKMDAEPHHFGWEVHGRISAFCNEDLFIRGNALAAGWDRESPRAGWRESLAAQGFADFKAFAQWAYTQMVGETHAGKMKPMDPLTREVMESLLKRGDEVVVVSNSGTERILKLFDGVGLSAVAHDQDPKAQFRVRGSASKFMLGHSPRPFSVGSFVVDTDRPLYEKILREERPDAVVGDVYSLDLALPGYLAQTDSQMPAIQLCLREQHYTPNWSREWCSQKASPGARVQMRVISALPQLLSIRV
jgi:FMN phosphatase YigB (HAD superfamily)